MAGNDIIGVFNNTQRIIALKGQVPVKDDKREPKRFCNRLNPGVLSFVPKAFWNIYKRNKVVAAMLDEEKLMVNKRPPAQNAAKEKNKSSAEIQQEATLKALAESSEDLENDDGGE